MAKHPPAAREAANVTVNELWTFSLSVYPTVSAHCLALQDKAGADINVILLLLYAASKGYALSVEYVAQVDRSCAQWRETVIRPLRGARRAVKTSDVQNAAELYSTLKSAELAAERTAQWLLARELHALSLSTDVRTQEQLARANLEAYRILIPMADAVVEDLLVAFGDWDVPTLALERST